MFLNRLNTVADTIYFTKISESSRNLLGTDRKEWNCEQILRFLTLLKVDAKLQTFFYQFKITGDLLFDLKYLWSQLSNYIDPKTYFPIMKLMHIIKQINIKQNKNSQDNNFLFVINNKEEENQLTKLRTGKFNKQNKISEILNTKSQSSHSKMKKIDLSTEVIKSFLKQFHELGEINLLDLSTNQLSKIFKVTEFPFPIDISDIIKRYSLDGFSLMYLLASKDCLLHQISNYFSISELELFDEILDILLPFYFQKLTDLPQNTINNKNLNYSRNYQQAKYENNLSKSFKHSEFGTSQLGTSEDEISEMGMSEIEEDCHSLKRSVLNNSMKKSLYGYSEDGKSQYENEQYGESEYANSQYAMSESGSLRGSLAQSQMGECVDFEFNNIQYQIKNRKQNKQNFVSAISDSSVMQRLRQVALDLPFNLFKMNPLQNIKITTINYPFTLQFHKSKSHEDFIKNVIKSLQKIKISSPNLILSKQFNITGVKFGRSQQNDFRYPDELSISGKHAQIVFWDNKYQLMDLQSKTGTFLYIPYTRPVILKDQQIIQLSNQIEILVHILKKQQGEGIIKLEFIKPENQPFYKASLKDNQILKIGRSEKSHIKLQQPSISSKHTQIKYENKEFKIYDCLSSTGTWLRLSKKGIKSQLFPLSEGDIIRISSKRTYLVEKMVNSLEDDDYLEEYEGILQNPNAKFF